MTVTFHNKKLGMCLSPARYHCGEISVEDIGIPQRAVVGEDDDEPKEIITQLHDEEVLSGMLPPRIPWGHKGTFGKLVSVCGSESYIGAAGISTLAALRTGVGLVNLCAPKAVINSLSSRILECTYSAMKTDSDGFMTSENVPNILSKLESADCLLIGCGLGHTPETERLVATLVENSPCQIILDADGINSLCPNIDVLSKRKSTVTLTPHPAELARLCGVSTAEILSDRHRYATEFARKYNVTVVSKGAETILTDGDYTNIIAVGNTALAKGGSGDMLAGIIASFSAQNPIRGDSNALLGCYVMGNTAEMLSEERSQRGILATDIIDALPKYLRQLERPFRLP
jgi:NAD(P)H-hydrate epimerase